MYVEKCIYRHTYERVCMAADGTKRLRTQASTTRVARPRRTDVVPVHFPQPLLGPPHRAEAPGALAQVDLVEGDAHSDDLVVAPARATRARGPGHGLDDQLDGLQAAAGRGVVQVAHARQPLAEALDELARAMLPGAQREARLHAATTDLHHGG